MNSEIMAYSTSMYQATSILLLIHFKTEEELYSCSSTRNISEMLNIPIPTVVKVLNKLNSAGLIQTKEGSKGGNLLARPITEITMLDVFTAIEQEKPLFKIQHDFNIEYDGLNSIVEKGVNALQNAEKAMKRSLEKVILSDLIE
jgi:Predicted transcriptional regulator